jgi:glycosyltransferase involved in cell wall biosynthesis
MAHLIFLTSTPSTVAEGSGTWVGITVLRDAIVALGHDVTILAPSPRAGPETTATRILFNLRILREIRSMHADAIIGFDLDGVFAPRNGCPHIAAIKGVIADEASHERGKKRIGLAIQARLERRHIARADRVITTSAYSSGRIASFYSADRAKILVVPELIDLDIWDQALRESPREMGPPRILCVAHLYPRKGVDTLLRAFARVRSDAVLRIAGTGPERERLQDRAHTLGLTGRVQFLGHLPFAALTAEYRNATLFALPTEQEGFGIVFLEAMASSLAIVTTRAAAVPEVVADGTTALLVQPGDDEALGRNLTALIEDRSLRDRLGAAGRAHVSQFAAPIVARQFLEAAGIGDLSS